MNTIELVKPGKIHEISVKEYIREHVNNGEPDIHGGALIEKMDYMDWLKQLADNSDKATVNPDWVVSSTFFAFRRGDNRLVGIIDIRHELNEFLASYGGHIGLGVRPSERKKGYAVQMLQQSLGYSRYVGLEKVMLACYKDNVASSSTIKKCGGILEKEFPLSEVTGFPMEDNSPERVVQVFWIAL